MRDIILLAKKVPATATAMIQAIIISTMVTIMSHAEAVIRFVGLYKYTFHPEIGRMRLQDGVFLLAP